MARSASGLAVGFVGLGSMGSAMARCLLRAGAKLTVWNRSPEPARDLGEQGATVAGTAREAAACGLVVSMLANDAAVDAVTHGDDGILAGLPAGGLHVSCSTLGVATAERFAAEYDAAGKHYLAAPVSGRPDAAAAAKLAIVTSGDDALVERAAPVFEAIGRRTFRIGARPADANLAKLAGNFLITCVIESLGEALTLGAKAGIARSDLLELFTETLFDAPVYRTYGKLIVEGTFSPAGFGLPLGLKDNRLALEAAETLAVPMPFGSIIRDRFLAALASGYGDLDWSALAKVVADQAGTPAA